MGAGLYFEEGDNVEQVKYQRLTMSYWPLRSQRKSPREASILENKVGCMLLLAHTIHIQAKPEDVWGIAKQIAKIISLLMFNHVGNIHKYALKEMERNGI